MSLDADALLGIRLAAMMTRQKFTRDPASVVAELRATAGGRVDVLAREAGIWAGFYDDEHTHDLAVALLEIDGAEKWVALGRRRRGARPYTSEGFGTGKSAPATRRIERGGAGV